MLPNVCFLNYSTSTCCCIRFGQSTPPSWCGSRSEYVIHSLAPNNECAYHGFARRVRKSVLPSGLVGRRRDFCLPFVGLIRALLTGSSVDSGAVHVVGDCAMGICCDVTACRRWWLVLVIGSGLVYVAIFRVPLTQKSSSWARRISWLISTVLGIGCLGSIVIEAIWRFGTGSLVYNRGC